MPVLVPVCICLAKTFNTYAGGCYLNSRGAKNSPFGSGRLSVVAEVKTWYDALLGGAGDVPLHPLWLWKCK